jgi:hypothetical protein
MGQLDQSDPEGSVLETAVRDSADATDVKTCRAISNTKEPLTYKPQYPEAQLTFIRSEPLQHDTSGLATKRGTVCQGVVLSHNLVPTPPYGFYHAHSSSTHLLGYHGSVYDGGAQA